MAVAHINYYYNTVSAALAAIVGWNFFVSVSGEDWNVDRFSLYIFTLIMTFISTAVSFRDDPLPSLVDARSEFISSSSQAGLRPTAHCIIVIIFTRKAAALHKTLHRLSRCHPPRSTRCRHRLVGYLHPSLRHRRWHYILRCRS